MQNGGTLSPSFIHDFKIKNIGNLNDQIKLNLSKNNKQNIALNCRKFIKKIIKSLLLKEVAAPVIFIFMNNNVNKGLSSKINRNQNSENKSNFRDTGSHFFISKKEKYGYHISSAIQCC